jgi:hypothetical protein
MRGVGRTRYQTTGRWYTTTSSNVILMLFKLGSYPGGNFSPNACSSCPRYSSSSSSCFEHLSLTHGSPAKNPHLSHSRTFWRGTWDGQSRNHWLKLCASLRWAKHREKSCSRSSGERGGGCTAGYIFEIRSCKMVQLDCTHLLQKRLAREKE